MGDAGLYVCEAHNSAGQTSIETSIIVQTIPIITITPHAEQITVKRGDVLRLECRATGHPQPMVRWVPLNQPLS